MKIKRAIVSVSDKTGLIPLVRQLRRSGVDIYATGGTLNLLRARKIPVHSISALTGFPEILDGRVKTLHPKVHGGLLYRRHIAKHVRDAKHSGIEPIDLVVINLYPFCETVRRKGISLEQAVEQIDIGGPAMIRSAAKNFESVAVVSDPADYDEVIAELKKRRGAVSLDLRRKLAQAAFQRTAEYDRSIARFLRTRFTKGHGELPDLLDVIFERSEPLRYGENPHQRAALYRRSGDDPRFSFTQLQGKQLSYNNILDLESAVDVLREFKETAACVVKHNNPCGISTHSRLVQAAEQAIDGDPMSAFGGIVGLNRPCGEAVARRIFEKLGFFEILVAPRFSKPALEVLKVRKNLRLIVVPDMYEVGPYDLRFAKSGVLVQDRDLPVWRRGARFKRGLRCVTREKPTAGQLNELVFAWKCAKVVRSNAIVLTKENRTVGIGGGQMSRVDSVTIACMKAGAKTRGSVLASDGFFPMPDNIEVAHAHGISAIIQPGGSIKDQEVIDACDRYGITMVFTNERHFKH